MNVRGHVKIVLAYFHQVLCCGTRGTAWCAAPRELDCASSEASTEAPLRMADYCVDHCCGLAACGHGTLTLGGRALLLLVLSCLVGSPLAGGLGKVLVGLVYSLKKSKSLYPVCV